MSESYKFIQSLLLIGLGAILSTFSYLPYGSFLDTIIEEVIWSLEQFNALILLVLVLGIIGLEMLKESDDMHVHFEVSSQDEDSSV